MRGCIIQVHYPHVIKGKAHFLDNELANNETTCYYTTIANNTTKILVSRFGILCV